MVVLIGFSLISCLVFLLWRARAAVRAASAYAGSQKRTAGSSEYHAVHIQFCEETACQAVRRHEGERFLANDAPELPLRECMQPKCLCRYTHYDDRRKITGRRAVDNGFDAQPYDGEERRISPTISRGRRGSDVNS